MSKLLKISIPILILIFSCKKDSYSDNTIDKVSSPELVLNLSYYEKYPQDLIYVSPNETIKDSVKIPFYVNLQINVKSIVDTLLNSTINNFIYVNDSLVKTNSDKQIDYLLSLKDEPVKIKILIIQKFRIDNKVRELSDSTTKTIFPVSKNFKGYWQKVETPIEDLYEIYSYSLAKMLRLYCFENRLYYITINHSIKKSDDLGTTWTNLTTSYDGEINGFRNFFVFNDSCYISTMDALYLYKNGHWNKIVQFNILWQGELTTDKINNNLVYSQSKPRLLMESKNGRIWDTLYQENSSDDYGRVWFHSEKSVLFLTKDGLYRSMDHSKTWNKISSSIIYNLDYLNNEIYGVTKYFHDSEYDISVLYSDNYGEEFTQIPLQINVINDGYPNFDFKVYNGNIFISNKLLEMHIYISKDKGKTLMDISDNLRTKYVNELSGFVNNYIVLILFEDGKFYLYKRPLSDFN